MALEDLRKVRLEKLENLKKAGIDPFPAKVEFPVIDISFFKKDFKKFFKNKKGAAIAGRITAKREHGNAIFADLFDGSDKFQIFIGRDQIGPGAFKIFSENIDVGDFIAVLGKAFYTKRKEPTIEVKKWQLLSKSLRPLPEKWHGLTDVEERFRKRYLDLLMNPVTRGVAEKRIKILKTAREFFERSGYLEVDTPILQPIYGGGLARPFKTHHNALNIPLYLRISDEMYLKRLIVGGFTKIFEICKDFRNEGMDHSHNPEFTLLEAMTGYQDYKFTMNLVEDFYEYVVKKVNKDLKVKYGNQVINFKRPWKKSSMKDIVRAKTGFDFDSTPNMIDARHKAMRLGISQEKIEQQGCIGEIMNLIFEEKVQPQLIQPTIVYDYPVETSPLAKKSNKDPRFVERFEHFILGHEHGNHYSELNDPIDLQERFVEETKKERAGFEEAHQNDKDFLEAIEYGMPPVTGLGISIDRLVILLTGVESIKEVILFPTLRPKNE